MASLHTSLCQQTVFQSVHNTHCEQSSMAPGSLNTSRLLLFTLTDVFSRQVFKSPLMFSELFYCSLTSSAVFLIALDGAWAKRSCQLNCSTINTVGRFRYSFKRLNHPVDAMMFFKYNLWLQLRTRSLLHIPHFHPGCCGPTLMFPIGPSCAWSWPTVESWPAHSKTLRLQ